MTVETLLVQNGNPAQRVIMRTSRLTVQTRHGLTFTETQKESCLMDERKTQRHLPKHTGLYHVEGGEKENKIKNPIAIIY